MHKQAIFDPYGVLFNNLGEELLYLKSCDGHKIKLWLQTSLLKLKFILNNIKKYGGTDIEPLMESLPIIYKTLKTYIKKHGHFTLVDIRSSDGEKVIIKV